MLKTLLAAGAAVLVPCAVAAQSATWTIDPGHSATQFTVRHMVVSNVRGQFDGPKGTVTFDPANLAGTLKADVTIDAKTINTRNPDRDKDLRSDLFFDVAKYPTIHFQSTGVEPGAAGHFKLKGNLTMHGITREVTLDVEGPTQAITDIWGEARIGATATTTVDRRDYKLLYSRVLEGGGAVVGNDVTITIDLEITRQVKKEQS